MEKDQVEYSFAFGQIRRFVTAAVFITFSMVSPILVFSDSASCADNHSLNINRTGDTSLAVTPHALKPSLALKENIPYLAWLEMDANGISRIYVRHQEDGEWVLNGGLLNSSSTGHAASPSLASSGNRLYAGWSETDTKRVSQIYLKEWDAGKWTQRWGSMNINALNNAVEPVLAGNDQSLYLAWTEINSAGISMIHVKQWDGTSWRLLGEQINRNTKRHGLTPSLSIGKQGVYLAWAEYDDQSIANIHVSRWDGEIWEPLGEALNIDPEQHAFSPSLSLAGSSPYIAWMEYNTEGISQIYVKYWDGQRWVSLGGSLNIDSSRHASAPSLGMKGSVPYVAWTEINNAGIINLHLKVWRKHSWLQTDSPLNITPDTSAASPVAALKDNSIYIAFVETDNRGIYQVYVKKIRDAEISTTAEENGKDVSSSASSPTSTLAENKKDGNVFFTFMPKAREATGLPPPPAFEYLPRTPLGEVDWMKGIREGILKPFDSTDPEARSPLSLNLDIILPVKKGFGIPDVVFPHLSHSMWLDCRNCHPAIFAPRRGGNPITMHRILEGDYCGRCHGVVAFRLYDCFRCHSASRSF